MKTISLILVVKNNPAHLFETIKPIDDIVSEIIIGNIDVGNDYIEKLQENKKIKIVDLPSDTAFADLVKEDLKKQAEGEYILYLDPDEIFPQAVKNFLRKNLGDYDYFLFPRKNIIFGKWIEHSRWWPDYQLRLFKKNAVTWPRELHPIPKGRGKEYKFKANESNSLLHYNYNNLDGYLEKATRYAKAEASFIVKKKEDYPLNQAVQKAVSEFISRFFAHDGYKDGVHGFVLAILQMFYYFLVYFYYWEKKRYSLREEDLSNNILNFIKQFHFETNFWLCKKNLVSSSKKLKLKIQNIMLNLFKS